MSSLVYAALLRKELSERNRSFAQKYGLGHRESFGSPPTVAYEPDESRKRHGNFLNASYRAILANEEWKRRFSKTHSQSRALPPAGHGAWKELDSCNSSDALLMNVFCCPNVLKCGAARLLGVNATASPEFGFKARVPLANGSTDRTEVDMRIDDLLVEAKLTETDFQVKAAEVVEAYRDFKIVFTKALLPRLGNTYLGYQLIRNVLAAFATAARFCVLLDQRRPDLFEAWHVVQRAVRPTDLRARCAVLTWQELAGVVPPTLARFLDEKYGISPRLKAATSAAT